MPSVGETLKLARIEQRLELDAVAARTKISAKYLEAIESDDRKKLPSGFFYKSFVDQYAKSLSLDTHEIDAEVERVLSADEPLPLPGFERVVARSLPPMRIPHRFRMRHWFTSAASLVLVLAGCSGVYALWHSARSSLNLRGVEAAMDNVRTFATSKLAKSAHVTEPAARVVETARPVAEIAGTVQRSAIRPTAAVLDTGRGSVASEIGPETASYGGAAAPASSDPASPDYKVVLDLVAHEPTWLSVSSDGKPVFSGTLQPNDTKIVSGKQFAKMRVGNAGGIEVRLNGKLLAPLGAQGQVLTVLFTPDNFQIFAPPKESD